MQKVVSIVAVVVGILFILLAGLYFVTPANALPHFIPGYSAVVLRHHFTHGVASLFLGLGSFVFAWFYSGKKS